MRIDDAKPKRALPVGSYAFDRGYGYVEQVVGLYPFHFEGRKRGTWSRPKHSHVIVACYCEVHNGELETALVYNIPPGPARDLAEALVAEASKVPR